VGIGGQIPLLMEKFLHFARVFEKKYQKSSPPLNFFHTKILKILPRKIPGYAAVTRSKFLFSVISQLIIIRQVYSRLLSSDISKIEIKRL